MSDMNDGKAETAYLILENGKVFEGKFFGAQGNVIGEIVFTTGMTGYLETLTDPSYYGQIVLQTFPLIGNYGIIPEDFESANVGVKAYIVKYPCKTPSNFRSLNNLSAFLKERGIIGMYGIDTRALTKIIRENGVMNGKITSVSPGNPNSVSANIEEIKKYSVTNPIAKVSQKSVIKSIEIAASNKTKKRSIALMDFGAKRGIANALLARDCEVWTFPYDTSAEDIINLKPNGIMLSNGPGDPADNANKVIIETLAALIKKGIPIFGICMGHQLLALANGYTTRKLKFGHRGANQPVKDMQTGKVYITSQNHGYEVVANNSSFINVNDGSCEGLDYGVSFSVQFHPEARGGPLDTSFLFDKFMERCDAYSEGRQSICL
ncbi:MAG: carbamoyl phosphate synthase small subunit [Treponema sp.]|nr:carbamoyl phosphate synthase small subunit [Treponema sp.]MCL2251730.1 carbamoyl phosphate synthase small subunit [Treponema sp.]